MDSTMEQRLEEHCAKLIEKETRSLKFWIIGGTLFSFIINILIKLYVPSATAPPTAPPTIPANISGNNTLNVGGAPEPILAPSASRDWLTVTEVAAQLKKDERTITSYITAGRIPAERTGRAYRIPKDFTLSPPQTQFTTTDP